MTTTTEIETVTITMSDQRPVKIDPAQWPVIAEAVWHDGTHPSQANTVRRIRVREHADGRRIIYGVQCAGPGGQHVGTRNPEGGFLVHPIEARPDEDETVRAIRRIGGVLYDPQLAAECIADLPAESL